MGLPAKPLLSNGSSSSYDFDSVQGEQGLEGGAVAWGLWQARDSNSLIAAVGSFDKTFQWLST